MRLDTVKIDKTATIRGVEVPAHVRFRQIIVTGPPGSGKSSLVARLGGWPEEGYLDLALKGWWKARMLTFRPREVQLGLPMMGYDGSLPVTSPEWLESSLPIAFDRIRIPPPRRGWLGVDWRSRYAFDVQLLPPDEVYGLRTARAREGLHPVDEQLTLAQVERQVLAYQGVALHLHRCGVCVYVRHQLFGEPCRIDVHECAPAPCP